MRRPARERGVVAALVVGLTGLGAGVGWARPGVALTPPTTPGTTSTTARRTPNSTTAGSTLETSTTVSGDPTTTATTSTTVASSGESVSFTGVVPPDAQARIDAVRRTPPGSTAALIAALAPLTQLGYTPVQAAIAGFGRFPVAGPARWADDFLEPRFGPDGSFSFHEGNDIPAACGTPIRTPSDGTVRPGSDPGGGNNVVVTEADGTYLYMAHLSAYPSGEVAGAPVKVGEVIGFVGETGAATGCHLHLEIHPRGGAAIDPKPFLDAWAADALADAPVFVAAARADRGV